MYNFQYIFIYINKSLKLPQLYIGLPTCTSKILYLKGYSLRLPYVLEILKLNNIDLYVYINLYPDIAKRIRLKIANN